MLVIRRKTNLVGIVIKFLEIIIPILIGKGFIIRKYYL